MVNLPVRQRIPYERCTRTKVALQPSEPTSERPLIDDADSDSVVSLLSPNLT